VSFNAGNVNPRQSAISQALSTNPAAVLNFFQLEYRRLLLNNRKKGAAMRKIFHI
jgi:hypothetical protein